MSIQPLEFEKPLFAMKDKINELEQMSQSMNVSLEGEIERLKTQADEVQIKLYRTLTPAQRLQIARHPQRPSCLDLIQMLSPDVWFELHGDRCGTDDRAIIGGIMEIEGRPWMVLGTQKGKNMKENLVHNFGMANPEGYRKALRLFQHAEKFNMPILTLIDTPGAYPGMDGEQHGIGQAIAMNIREMARMHVPIISVVMGEASSGGALGIGVANKIYLLEHALYTVISPEGCASILWRSAEYASRAAEALKITSHDLLEFGIIDGVIEEPTGGAHYDPNLCAERVKETVLLGLESVTSLGGSAEWIQQRYDKYRGIGAFCE
ncbi:MAG: acetyl-CoA carboxylase carboxyltransferase subunit alpha [Cyanobacteria bacterium]|nr:acetyl-CoA carboxylase carboxyltransferase subunit alpha [Cyanobacteriota bacterium]